jgi:4-amino-4-deoxy-L-arabinose transferase-like glycosyltransferase
MPSITAPALTSPRPQPPALSIGRQNLSLVIPAHNEEPIIRQAIVEAVAALSSLEVDYEIIVVDDGSTDGTRDAALDAARQTPQVRIVTLPSNVGYAAALRRGFREARYELVAFTDADCQFDLRELDRLLPLTQVADIVCGIRIDRKDAWRRKVYSKGFNILARSLLGTGVTDCDCALKIFRRNWVNSAGLHAEGFFFNAELLARARQAGLTVAEVGVTHRPRQGGTSKVSIAHVLPVLKTLLLFWWSQVLFTRPGSSGTDAPISFWKTLAGVALLGVLAAISVLPSLSYPLLDPDETRYAEIAKEMIESGNLLVPTRQGMPYLDKPPLLYWLTAGSFHLFGVNEFAARFVTSTAAIGTILCMFWIGRLLVGHRAAWLGSLLSLMCIGFVLSGRFLFMDSLLTLFTTVSLLAGYAACRGETFRTGYWALAAVSCGLGTLTKGPVAPALCLPPLLASCWMTSAGTSLRLRHWISYLGIVAAIAVPWFVVMAIRQPQYFYEFIWKHHVERFVSGLSHEEPMWFYVPILLIGMAPCSILFPAAVAFFARSEKARRYRTWDVGYLLLFAGWTLGIFSVSSCKLPPYILPAIPALCLVVGTALAAILESEPRERFLAYVRGRSPRDLCVILTLGAPVVAVIDILLLGEGAAVRFGGYAALSAAGVLLVVVLSRDSLQGVYVRWGLAAVYSLFVMSYGVKDFAPAVAVQRCKVSPILQFCQTEIARSTPIVCYALNQEEDAFAFYFDRHRVQAFNWDDIHRTVTALKDSPHALLFADSRNVSRLLERLPSSVELIELGRYEHIGVWVTGTQVEQAASPFNAVDRTGTFDADALHPVPFGPTLDAFSRIARDGTALSSLSPGWPAARN